MPRHNVTQTLDDTHAKGLVAAWAERLGVPQSRVLQAFLEARDLDVARAEQQPALTDHQYHLLVARLRQDVCRQVLDYLAQTAPKVIYRGATETVNDLAVELGFVSEDRKRQLKRFRIEDVGNE